MIDSSEDSRYILLFASLQYSDGITFLVERTL